MHHLLEVTYRPRFVAYWIAALLVISVPDSPHAAPVYLASCGLALVYPYLLQKLLLRYSNSAPGAWHALIADSLWTGLFVALVGFAPVPVAVLVTMLIISAAIVGGRSLVFTSLPLLAVSAALGRSLYAGSSSHSETLLWASLAGLICYITYVGYLVYQETRRLNQNHRREYSRRFDLEQMRDRIRPFLMPQLINHRESSQVRRKRLTIFFSDIEGFTRLMEAADEVIVAEILSEYFEEMSRITSVHGGTVNKLMGDGMMVLFGDQTSDGPQADAYACVSMAVEMRRRMRVMSGRWSRIRALPPVHIRIGIHSGYCLVGSFGGCERMDYTALGSAVNLASRLEAAAGQDDILVSNETYLLIQPLVRATRRGEMMLKGFAHPVVCWSIDALTSRGNGRFLSGNIKLLS